MLDLFKVDDCIWVWTGFDTEELLNRLLSKQWESYNNDGGGSTLIGRSTTINPDDELYEEILEAFKACLNEYTPAKESGISESNMDSNKFIVREYSAGSYMTEHGDAYSYVRLDGQEVAPILTAILYLNEDYTGGDIEFVRKGISLKPKAGSLVIFPSSDMHKVNTVIQGNRYMTQTYIHNKNISEYEEK